MANKLYVWLFSEHVGTLGLVNGRHAKLSYIEACYSSG